MTNSQRHDGQSCSNAGTGSLGWTRGRGMSDHDVYVDSSRYKGREDIGN